MMYYEEKDLWKWFSLFIRTRDAGAGGITKCFTCGFRGHWRKNFDCGHGHGRQHLGTKYNEQNNHAQCANCNAFNGGRQDVYKEEVDRKYGPGTWQTLDWMARQVKKFSAFEVHQLTLHYYREAKALADAKGLLLPDTLPSLEGRQAKKAIERDKKPLKGPKKKVPVRVRPKKEKPAKGEQWAKWLINRKRDQ